VIRESSNLSMNPPAPLTRPLRRRALATAWLGLALALIAGWRTTPPLLAADAGAAFPNILLIYADDLGYGDLGCYGAERVRTPHADRLAREGLRFTDAHSAAATCTPSRYAMLTGEYAWRRKGTGVLPGDAGAILEPGRTTLATVLKAAGYATGVVGKWHLGLGPGPGKTDWNEEIRPGPLEIGFDYAFLMPATGDRVPCVYVENRRVVGLDPADPIRVSFAGPIGDEPTGKSRPDLLTMPPSHGHDMTIVDGISRIGYMTGGKAARWKDADMADEFVRRGVGFLERHKAGAAAAPERPFFLYFATHDIHVPRVPHPRFAGRTPMGPRGDAIAQFDATVGELLGALDRLGYATNTLVILTSDNGPVVDDGYRDDAVTKLGDHRPSGPWRGGKYSAFEAGTRVPFLVRWPAQVAPGTTTDALFGQIDLIASFAALTGQDLKSSDAPDSRRMLPTLIGRSRDSRAVLVEQAGVLSVREGPWKYIEPGKGARRALATNTETGQDPDGQLFDLAADPGERTNLIRLNPERARVLKEELDAIRQAGKGQP
jgi:arylsulfatase A-like enzyme